MILSAIKQIGDVMREPISREEKEIIADERIIKYINLTYSPPNPSRYLVLEINLEAVISHLGDIHDAIRVAIEKGIYSEIDTSGLKGTRKGFKVPKKGEVFEGFFNALMGATKSCLSEGKSFEDLKDHLDVLPADFDDARHDSLRMMLGNQKGTSVYYSPTMFCSTAKKRLKEFPLWKINLAHDFKDEGLKKFFEIFPSVNDYTNLDLEDSTSILKYLSSHLFLDAINDHVQDDWDLKKMVYVVPVIDGKWPYQVSDFVNYYTDRVAIDSDATKGICELCGEKKEVTEGLTKELGFYTKNQEGFNVIGMKSGNLMCPECINAIQRGFTYVKENLEYFIAQRGTNKSPIMSYLIPYTWNNHDLKTLLQSIQNPSKKAIDNVKAIGKAAKDALDSQAGEETAPEEDEIIDDLLTVLGLEAGDKFPYSLYVITFYHPEGQSKEFHNILDIIPLNHDKCVKLRDAIVNAKTEGNHLMIKHLHHVFGIKAVEHIRRLLRLEPFNMEKTCLDAFVKIKREFLEDAMKNVGKKQNSSFTIRKFKWFLNIANRLELIQVGA